MTSRLAALKTTRRSRRQDEHRLQCDVVGVLLLAGVKDMIFYAVPNGLVSNAVSVSRMKSAGLTPGVADLTIILPGAQAVQLELKTAKGVQSPEQLAFEARCKANGTRYFVASSLDEAIDVLAGIGALRLDRVRGLQREPTRSAAA